YYAARPQVVSKTRALSCAVRATSSNLHFAAIEVRPAELNYRGRATGPPSATKET
ncbi:unnamed protein product, partial [Amoebophrya sp. A25]